MRDTVYAEGRCLGCLCVALQRSVAVAHRLVVRTFGCVLNVCLQELLLLQLQLLGKGQVPVPNPIL